MTQTLGAATRALAKRISKRPFADAQREARLIMEHVTGLEFTQQIVNGDRVLVETESDAIETIAKRREVGEPLARILARASFRDFEVELSPSSLIPRDDTSALVDAALNRIPHDETAHIADLGTGSGIVLLALAKERSKITGVGFDIAQQALNDAARNAAALGLESQLSFIKSDWFSGSEGSFDGIVSNPPYISDAEYAELPDEVARFDPELALKGGQDGLDPYRAIFHQAPARMRPNGWLIVEVGAAQAAQVAELARIGGFELIEKHKDLAGRDRVLEFAFARY